MWSIVAGIANFLLLLGSCIYYLRVPLASVIVLAGLPLIALRIKSAQPLLAGLFDVSGKSRHESRPAMFGMFAVTLTALGAAWSAFLPFRLVMAHGAERFGHPWLNHAHFTYLGFFLFTAGALPAIGEAWKETKRQGGIERKPLLWGAALGVALGGLLFGGAYCLEPLLEGSPAVRWLIWLLSLRPGFGAGYVGPDPANPESIILLPSHGLALALFVIMGGVYAAAGWKRRERIPALAYVHLLVMVLCWLLAGMAFFLDHYDVPLLAVLVLWFLLMSRFSRSDNFYVLKRAKSPGPLFPAEVLGACGRKKIILVAASGGGIQAAAWTARVLTGLEQECGAQQGASGSSFAKAVRLISSVSGGSVGAMYFVNAYQDGSVPANDLEEIVRRAEASTLEEIAWGLAYPDFWRNTLPFPPFTKRNLDRGNALEDAWKLIEPRLKNGLSDWRAEVRAGERPAVIFNATIVDTGQRLILSTTDFKDSGPAKLAGRINFYSPPIYPERDISIATAARLSASFPYVTPAARASGEGPRQARFHVVDGGYYDNYGVASLLEWLDQALEIWSGTAPEILILQVRDSAPVEAGIKASHRGWIYQALAPLETLMSVRDTAQPAYNEFAVKTLIDKYMCRGMPVHTVVFEFQGKHPPLSWHMTLEEKENIESAWKTSPEVRRGVTAVKEFLA